MREVEFYYVEVVDETNNIIIFSTKFDGEEYGAPLTLNLALPIEVQDIQIRKTIKALKNMKRKDAKEAL